MIKLKQWEKLPFQPLHYLAAEPWGDANILFFKKPKAIIVVLAFLNAGFNEKTSSSGASNLITARLTIRTWLIFCLRNGKTKISYICYTTNRPPTFVFYRFVTSWRTLLKKRFSVASTVTGWLLSTIDVYKAATYPTIIRCTDLFRLRTSFSRLFRRRCSLRRV